MFEKVTVKFVIRLLLFISKKREFIIMHIYISCRYVYQMYVFIYFLYLYYYTMFNELNHWSCMMEENYIPTTTQEVI